MAVGPGGISNKKMGKLERRQSNAGRDEPNANGKNHAHYTTVVNSGGDRDGERSIIKNVERERKISMQEQLLVQYLGLSGVKHFVCLYLNYH